MIKPGAAVSEAYHIILKDGKTWRCRRCEGVFHVYKASKGGRSLYRCIRCQHVVPLRVTVVKSLSTDFLEPITPYKKRSKTHGIGQAFNNPYNVKTFPKVPSAEAPGVPNRCRNLKRIAKYEFKRFNQEEEE